MVWDHDEQDQQNANISKPWIANREWIFYEYLEEFQLLWQYEDQFPSIRKLNRDPCCYGHVE